MSQETAEAVAALNSHVQVAHIPGAGHSIRREQPQRYLAVVQEFLRSCIDECMTVTSHTAKRLACIGLASDCHLLDI
ncbi:MAG: hypothetical protein R2932_17295 [Caldilineaceae bacterium]